MLLSAPLPVPCALEGVHTWLSKLSIFSRISTDGACGQVTANFDKSMTATGGTPERALGELLRVASKGSEDLTQVAVANVLTVDPWNFW